MSKDSYDRYEFINAVIGWLGTDEMYMEILNCDKRTLDDYIQDESERFEDDLAKSLSDMSNEELNSLCFKYNLNTVVYD